MESLVGTLYIYMTNRESHDGDYDLLYYLLSFVVKRIILIK